MAVLLIGLYGCSGAATQPEVCTPAHIEGVEQACEIAMAEAPTVERQNAIFLSCVAAIEGWRQRCR